jgi:hypothetical protein
MSFFGIETRVRFGQKVILEPISFVLRYTCRFLYNYHKSCVICLSEEQTSVQMKFHVHI